jgi:hypothetical protein
MVKEIFRGVYFMLPPLVFLYDHGITAQPFAILYIRSERYNKKQQAWI